MPKLVGWQESPQPKRKRKGIPYRDRQFVAWDTEGITYVEGEAQCPVLFGNSLGLKSVGENLSSVQMLTLMLRTATELPNAIHVGFAFGYDTNQILKDLPVSRLSVLKRTNHVRWNGYRIEWMPGKWLQVTGTYEGERRTCKIFDVFGFFQTSFIKATESFFGKDDPELAFIREGKQARGTFKFEELDEFVIPYWEAELRVLVRLMNQLRNDFNDADIDIRSWHGPGAAVGVVFKKHRIEKHMAIHGDITRKAQFAYAGGRFELLKCGYHQEKVWEYDINSAYPFQIAQLPSLSNQHGAWRYCEKFVPNSFGIWFVDYDYSGSLESSYATYPLFHRTGEGLTAYPAKVTGWYWTPEAAFVPDKVLSGYVWDSDGTRPFDFVPEMYATRKRWKKEGKSAERALKLALNSMYGKLAQRTGYDPQTGKIPIWHQLEWAGYVTSAARAMIFNAMSLDPTAIISVETDAVFTTRPLPLKTGSNLGEWEETIFDEIAYLQSGFYFGRSDGKPVTKYRGFDPSSISWADVHTAFRDSRQSIVGSTTRFVGLGAALQTKAIWRSWETSPRALIFGGGGKRAHKPSMCKECKMGMSLADGLHGTVQTISGGINAPHSLPWVDEPTDWQEQKEVARW